MEAVSLGSVFFVQRDSAEDPLDDSGTVQQQLDQVTDKYLACTLNMVAKWLVCC